MVLTIVERETGWAWGGIGWVGCQGGEVTTSYGRVVLQSCCGSAHVRENGRADIGPLVPPQGVERVTFD